MLSWLLSIFRIRCNSLKNVDRGKLRGPVQKIENTEEQMKIHQWVKKRELASRIKPWLSYQSGKKMKSREDKDAVKKKWELDSNIERVRWVRYRRIVGLIDTHWNIIPAQFLPALSLVCFLRSTTLAFVSYFVFAILLDHLQEKPSYGEKMFSALSALRNISVFGDSSATFTAKVMVVNIRSADWLSYLRSN